MAFYLVSLPPGAPARVLFNGKSSALVWAETADDAKDMVKSMFDGDANDLWSVATAVAAPADMEGWTVRVRVYNPAGVSGVEVIADVTATGEAADVLADILAGVVTALNATADIAGADYATGTLTVAETTDALGDMSVDVWVKPPVFAAPESVDGFVTSITDAGASGDALEVVFDVDRAIPAIVSSFRA